MVTCVAVGCTNRKQLGGFTGVTFHTFPKDQERRTKWINALKRFNWLPTPYSVLCSDHFRPEDIDRTSYSCVVLKKCAVPCIFPEQSADSNQDCEDDNLENMKISENEILENSQEYLICLIEAHPILYDPSDPDSGDEEKVAETWQIVADVIDLSVEDCQREWDALLSKYEKQRSVIIEHEAKGHKAKSTWGLYDTFNFIDKQLRSQEEPITLFNYRDLVTPNDAYKSWVHNLIQNIKPVKQEMSEDISVEDQDLDHKDFTSHSNGFEINPGCQAKKRKTNEIENEMTESSLISGNMIEYSLINHNESLPHSTIIRHSENTSQTKPVITDINEDVQFVNSILPVLVRMKRKKKAQCKAQLMAALAKYESDDEP